MTHPFWLNRSLSTVFSLVAASSVISGACLPTVKTQPLTISFGHSTQQSFATTSGGRTRGGGFGDDEPAEAERSAEPASGRPYSENNYRPSNHNYDRYDDSNNHSGNSGGGATDVIIFCMFFIFLVYLIKSGTLNTLLESAKKTATADAIASSPAAPHTATPTARTASRRLSTEITNNIVTVTQVQVAMLSQARHVQQTLSQIAEDMDMSDQQSLTIRLRETVLTLLRSPETWTHAFACSKTVKTKQAAKEKFENLSLEERRKFDVESLSNVDGKIHQQAIIQREQGPAAYIVVTLIVGTAHDNPLIEPVTSADELTTALKKLGSITPDYLMVYEVLWSPQDESDSLTDDELLLNYPHMLQIS